MQQINNQRQLIEFLTQRVAQKIVGSQFAYLNQVSEVELEDGVIAAKLSRENSFISFVVDAANVSSTTSTYRDQYNQDIEYTLYQLDKNTLVEIDDRNGFAVQRNFKFQLTAAQIEQVNQKLVAICIEENERILELELEKQIEWNWEVQYENYLEA